MSLRISRDIHSQINLIHGETLDAIVDALGNHSKAAQAIAAAAGASETASKVAAISTLSDLLNSGDDFSAEQRDNMELKLNELINSL